MPNYGRESDTSLYRNDGLPSLPLTVAVTDLVLKLNEMNWPGEVFLDEPAISKRSKITSMVSNTCRPDRKPANQMIRLT
jgi:hypothetical protein